MAGPSSETLREVKATRRELARLNADFERLHKTGRSSGSNFGKSFKKAAITGVKELAKGAVSELGSHLMKKFLDRGKRGGKAFGKSFKKSAKTEMSTLSSGMKFNLGAMSVIGAAALSAAIVSQMKSSLESAFEQERVEISLDALTGGGGADIFEKLRSEALRTGRDVGNIAKSVTKMIGLGFEEADALAMTRSVMDLAGALGMTEAEADLVTNAISQIKGKGKPAMEELRGQLGERAVPILEEIKNRYGEDWEKMVQQGKVGVDEILGIFQNLEGALGKFKGGADRFGGSAPGLFARLKQEVIDLRRQLSFEMLPEIKPLLRDALEYVKGMKDEASAFGAKMGEVIGKIRATFQALSFGEILQKAVLEMDIALHKALDTLIRGIATAIDLTNSEVVGDGLERAAHRFKIALLDSIAEALYALSSDTAMGKRFEVMAAQVDAASMKGRVAAPSGKGPIDWPALIKETFDSKSGVFGGRIAQVEAALAPLNERIARQRKKNLAEQEVEPAAPASGGSSTAPKKAAAPSGGIIAGGLANALSRIAGGPNTIIMERQLDAMKGTQKAAQETKTAVEDLTKVVKRQKRRGAPAFT